MIKRSPVTRGSRARVMNLHMLGGPPWMFLASTSSPYSSAALSLPIAAASLQYTSFNLTYRLDRE